MVIIIIVRRFQISNIFGIVDQQTQVQHRFTNFYNLVKLLAFIFIMAHYCACCFYNISAAEAKAGGLQNWIANKNLQDKSEFELYINALYFSFITMITVGFGGNAIVLTAHTPPAADRPTSSELAAASPETLRKSVFFFSLKCLS